MSTDLVRHRLGGSTMGTTWQVVLDSDQDLRSGPLADALQTAVDRVDNQMSTWKPDSTLMRFNAAPCGDWIALPVELLTVLDAGQRISADTDGAFEMNVGDAVRAWGFGAAPIDLAAIHAARAAPRARCTEALQIDRTTGLARKTAPLALDLSGIAKGFGVDQLVGVLARHGIAHALCAIDGELRAIGTQGDGRPWTVAIERPDDSTRRALAQLDLHDGAVATSGDYRHFVTVSGQRLAHTIDPGRGSPLVGSAASVSVLAATCMLADAMATALMVMGPVRGAAFAEARGISALFVERGASGLVRTETGIFRDSGR